MATQKIPLTRIDTTGASNTQVLIYNSGTGLLQWGAQTGGSGSGSGGGSGFAAKNRLLGTETETVSGRTQYQVYGGIELESGSTMEILSTGDLVLDAPDDPNKSAGWDSNGSQIVTINTSDKVGIGTATPLSPLHITAPNQLATFAPSGARSDTPEKGAIYIDSTYQVGYYTTIDFGYDKTNPASGPVSRIGSYADADGSQLHFGVSNEYARGITATPLVIHGNNNITLSAVPIAKAWITFNGTGTVSINDSYNVSSLVDIGTGAYRVVFATAMSTSTYATTFGCGYDHASYAPVAKVLTSASTNYSTGQTETSCEIGTYLPRLGYYDFILVNAMFMGK
jgi:hypothetical protein